MTQSPGDDEPQPTQPITWQQPHPGPHQPSWGQPAPTPSWGQPTPGAGGPPTPYAGWPGAPVPHPAPYGVHPVSGLPYSDKSKATAGLLQLLLPFVSVCGVGRLYAGHTAIGLIQLIGLFVAWFLTLFVIGLPFLIGIWLWSVIDGIVILAGDSKDSAGRLLR